jgi:hypothetical protein
VAQLVRATTKSVRTSTQLTVDDVGEQPALVSGVLRDLFADSARSPGPLQVEVGEAQCCVGHRRGVYWRRIVPWLAPCRLPGPCLAVRLAERSHERVDRGITSLIEAEDAADAGLIDVSTERLPCRELLEGIRCE